VKLEDEPVRITKTGMYSLFFISCDPKLRGLTMSGKTIWKNPGGYLPGRMAPLMKFYVLVRFKSFGWIIVASLIILSYLCGENAYKSPVFSQFFVAHGSQFNSDVL
jgi:hypothetical protein